MADKIYNIPLRRAFGKRKRANSAIHQIKEFLDKHVDSENIIIDPTINEEIWAKGIGNIPRRVRVKVEEFEEEAVATLAE